MGRVFGIVVGVAAVVFALLAAAGWYAVTQRDGELSDARAQSRAATIQVMALTKQQQTLEASLAAMQQDLVATRQRLAAAKAPPTAPSPDTALFQRKVAEADARLQAASAKVRADVAAETAAHTRQASTPSPPPSPPTPVGTNGLTPSAHPGPAPALPDPGLPSDASAHAYLVAAEQAVGAGHLGRAQSALERAEVTLLNETQLAPPRGVGGHPAIEAIEQALDRLGAGDRASASVAIRRVLQTQGR